MNNEHLIKDLSTRVEELLGLHFPKNRWNDLERGLFATAKELKINAELGSIALWLAGHDFLPGQLDVLANNLTIGETYFFRDKPVLEIFKSYIIKELLALRFGKNQRISLWSAGCCTGEEPYTLAMLLCETIPELYKWDISILATDINPRFLDKAVAGIYGNWSFRETPEHLKAKYFQKVGDYWQISEQIRSMVIFRQLNLAEDTYPSRQNLTLNMDVIFCRNVLMYFSNELITQVGSRFFDALNPAGWLITSAVELNDELFPDFSKVSYDNSIIYRKSHQNLVVPQKDNFHDKILSPIKRLHVQQKKGSKTLGSKPSMSDHPRAVGNLHEITKTEIATQFFLKGSYTECTALCHKELLDNPDQPALLILLTRTYANTGRLDDALNCCDQLIKLDSFNSEVYYLMATILFEKQELDKAVNALRRGLYINHDHLMSHFLMVNVMRCMFNTSGAEVHLKNIKRILSGLDENHVLDEAEGLTVKRIIEMVNSQ